MMIDWKRKLTSRKFWAAVCDFVGMLLVALHVAETDATIKSKSQQNLNGWYTKANIAKLRAVANQHPPVWGFDCVNLIKGILWGWWGNPDEEKGGAVYASNGIPDTNADGMIRAVALGLLHCTGIKE